MKMVNREGESGHPRLVPLFNMKVCEAYPLVISVAEGEINRILTQVINDCPKLNLIFALCL